MNDNIGHSHQVHFIFRPSTSTESVGNDLNYDYHVAEHLGKTMKNCKYFFSECKLNFMEKFTHILYWAIETSIFFISKNLLG